jgi:hypothetical protein
MQQPRLAPEIDIEYDRVPGFRVQRFLKRLKVNLGYARELPAQISGINTRVADKRYLVHGALDRSAAAASVSNFVQYHAGINEKLTTRCFQHNLRVQFFGVQTRGRHASSFQTTKIASWPIRGNLMYMMRGRGGIKRRNRPPPVAIVEPTSVAS